jgi:hypothetical protein
MKDNNFDIPFTPEEREQRLREQMALAQILDKGLAFNVPRLNTGFLFKGDKKNRVFIIHKPYLSTMDLLADIYLQMRLNVDDAHSYDKEQRQSHTVKNNSLLAAKAIATIYLNRGWKIKLFGKLLTKYLHRRLDSGKLSEIADIMDVMQDYGNFTYSIRLMAGTARTSEPKADQIEEK